MPTTQLIIDSQQQKLIFLQDALILKTYPISTALKGLGEQKNSFQTPRGWHKVRAKIGSDQAIYSIFKARRPSGQIYDLNLARQYPNTDWILSRIIWLSGLEVGKNRLGNCDTMQRYIYIHGTSDEVSIGKPNSMGCIRMNNQDMLEVFDLVSVGQRVFITYAEKTK
jgi:lipoprotein-anchoring transpeptidase ErfK/SrfK